MTDFDPPEPPQRSSRAPWEDSPTGRDQDALNQIYLLVRRVASRYLLNDPHSVEDVVQECMAMILQKAPRYGLWPPPPAWVNTVASNFCKDWRLSNCSSQYAEVPLDDARLECVPSADPLPDVSFEAKRLRSAITKALADLSVIERMTVRLIKLEGFSCREAAKSLGVSKSTAFCALRRGLARLQSSEALAEWAPMTFCREARGGERPMVVYESDNDILASLRHASCSGAISLLLTGMRQVSSFRKLEACVRRHSGSPVVVDPALLASERVDVAALEQTSRGSFAPRVVFYGRRRAVQSTSQLSRVASMKALIKGMNDNPRQVQETIIYAIAGEENEELIARTEARAPAALHRLVRLILRMSVRRVSVRQVARRMGISHQAVAKQCRVHGLPAPRRLVDIASIYHIERLARWSGCSPDRIALGFGFGRRSSYGRLTCKALGQTPSKILEAGGPDHVAGELLRQLGRDEAA